jgi:hypothetical protein
MSRYHKDRDDKGAWKKGAGPYSKSYAKTTDKSPSMRGYQTAVEGPWSDFYKTPEAGGSVQDLIRGRQVRGAFKVDPNFGLSAALPRGHRPSHRAGKLSGSGIDAPDSTSFKRHKDYR